MGWGGPRTCTPNPDLRLEPSPASCVRVALPPPRVDRSELTSSHPPSEPTSRSHLRSDVTWLKAAMLPAPWGSPRLPP